MILSKDLVVMTTVASHWLLFPTAVHLLSPKKILRYFFRLVLILGLRSKVSCPPRFGFVIALGGWPGLSVVLPSPLLLP
ncbi:hypothetical protein BDF19DRAFT_451103 [Syncephalis fuscata]|nr:hypothetical protein BDF19DRAFT_451103 [Syncephalis fuscata]